MKRKIIFYTNGFQRVFYPKKIHDTIIVNGIHIDKKIYPLIKILWENNIRTFHSCQGGDLNPFQNNNESTYIINGYYVNNASIIIYKKDFSKIKKFIPKQFSIENVFWNNDQIWIYFNNKWLKQGLYQRL